MKNYFTFTQLRLVGISWYILLFIISFASLGSSCSCVENGPIDSISADIDTPTSPSLQFEKLSYDRDNQRIVAIIKNTSKNVAKDLSLRCTNISKEEESIEIRFNNNLKTTTISVPELPANTSTQEIYVAIDFKEAKNALVQAEIIYSSHLKVRKLD